ncbi:MAG TPA: zinc ABC transporter substrate-binding protein [Gaiellaceae bacterium]|nr:zinc ABC transporter substrate-binding protein [Gaiellaceae bacterium]
MLRFRTLAVLAAAPAALLATAWLAGGGAGAHASGQLQVAAAENVWGSIAAQLGGDRVSVTSIVSNPATDPHDYEPTALDARTLAGARLVIVNGAGYDAWAPKLLAANPVSGRVVLTVADLVGVRAGGNPHLWYSPEDVRRAVAAITRDFRALEPGDAAFFAAREARFEDRALRGYGAAIARIRRRFAGTRVGASESVVAPLARALGLHLGTPAGLLRAVAEGSEPTAQDLATAGRQLAAHAVRVWIENGQNETPDVQRLTAIARAHGIPVATITETLAPADTTFQAWQLAQLRRLEAALARGARRG